MQALNAVASHASTSNLPQISCLPIHLTLYYTGPLAKFTSQMPAVDTDINHGIATGAEGGR